MSNAGRDLIAEQAAAWIVQLTADDEAVRAHAAAGFERWRQADPRHAAAATRMEALLGQVRQVSGQRGPARVALDAACRPRRGRRVAAVLTLLLALVLPPALVVAPPSPAALLADLRSGPGEWQLRELPDGSRLALGGGSAVNIRFDGRQRVVELVHGAIRVEVAPDRARPFRVETMHGAVRALGTRFIVTLGEQSTQLDMLESRVAVRAGSDRELEVSAGQSVRFQSGRIDAVAAIDIALVDAAWHRRQLVVDAVPLPEVLVALQRHHRGRILYDAERLQDIRVTAVLPLDDSERALQLLARSFPALRIGGVAPWLVTVAHAAPI